MALPVKGVHHGWKKTLPQLDQPASPTACVVDTRSTRRQAAPLLLSRSLTQVELPRPALSAVSKRGRSSSGECPCLPIAPLGGPLPFLSVTNARVVLLGPLVYLFALHCPGWQTTSSAQCGEAITVLVTVFRPRAEFPPFLFFFFVFLSDVPRTLPSTKRPPTTTLSTLYSTVLIQKASSRQGLNTCMDPTQE